MSNSNETRVATFTQSDGHVTHYRHSGPASGPDAIVMLHGGMSHAGWQSPLADECLALSANTAFIAVDRRGSGLNTQQRGHMPSTTRILDDLAEFLSHLSGDFSRVHLGGWCFGAQLAVAATARAELRAMLSSLLMVSPGFAYTDRYSAVLHGAIESALAVVQEFGLEPGADRPFITLPIRPDDFTSSATWQDFVKADDLRLTMLSQSAVSVSLEIAEHAERALSTVGAIPALAVFGGQDRLVDVDRTRAMIANLECLETDVFDSGHAVQFDQPRRLAGAFRQFIAQVPASSSSMVLCTTREPG